MGAGEGPALIFAKTADPVRSCSLSQRSSLPAQPHQSVADQPVDRCVDGGHCAAPVQRDRARHFTWADRSVRCAAPEQRQRRNPRIGHSAYVAPARHPFKPRKELAASCRLGVRRDLNGGSGRVAPI